MKYSSKFFISSVLFPVLIYANPNCIKAYEENHLFSNVISIFSVNKAAPNIDIQETVNGNGNENVIAFRAPKKAITQPKLTNEYEELAEVNIKFLYALSGMENLDQLKLTQQSVWRIHSSYSIVKDNYLFLMKHPEYLSKQSFEKLEDALKKTETVLAESKFFEKIVEKGYSLVPKSSDTMKELLPAEVNSALSVLDFNLSFLKLELSHVKNLDSIYFDKFRRNLLNSLERRLLAPSIESFLESLVGFLDKSTKAYKPSLFDYEEVITFLDSVDTLVNTKKFAEYHKQNLNSYFNKTRQHSENVQRLLIRYAFLRNTLKNNGKNSLSVNASTIAAQSRISLQNVDQLRNDLIVILRGRAQDGFINYEAMLEKTLEVTSLIKSPENMEASEQTFLSLQSTINLVERIIEDIPKKKSLFGIGKFTGDEIDQANQIRAEIGRLKKIFPNLQLVTQIFSNKSNSP